MAAITESTNRSSNSASLRASASGAMAAPTALTVALLLALAITLGGAVLGLYVSAAFLIGTAVAHVTGRPLTVDEFAGISMLHAAAVVVLALNL